jgi:hypothetical protein
MGSRFETLATIVAEAFVIGYKCCLKNIEKNKNNKETEDKTLKQMQHELQ